MVPKRCASSWVCTAGLQRRRPMRSCARPLRTPRLAAPPRPTVRTRQSFLPPARGRPPPSAVAGTECRTAAIPAPGAPSAARRARHSSAVDYRGTRMGVLAHPAECRLTPAHICAGTGLTPPTSALELGSPLPHLRRDCWTSQPAKCRAVPFCRLGRLSHPRRALPACTAPAPACPYGPALLVPARRPYQCMHGSSPFLRTLGKFRAASQRRIPSALSRPAPSCPPLQRAGY
jgi:hypothetical protein